MNRFLPKSFIPMINWLIWLINCIFKFDKMQRYSCQQHLVYLRGHPSKFLPDSSYPIEKNVRKQHDDYWHISIYPSHLHISSIGSFESQIWTLKKKNIIRFCEKFPNDPSLIESLSHQWSRTSPYSYLFFLLNYCPVP